MALKQRLELRQGQSLVMTPQLQQAIKLLTLSNLELAEYVEGELEKNPLLEREEPEQMVAEGQSESEPAGEGQEEPLEEALGREDFSKVEDLDADRHDVYAEEQGMLVGPHDAPLTDWTSVRAHSIDAEDGAFGRKLEEAPTLKDHLLGQLSMAPLGPEQRLIAASLIDGIDEAGYLRTRVSDIAAQLGATETAVGDVLLVVQGFEPTGVAARDLAECLGLQLRERGRLDPAMHTLLMHLDLVARRDTSMLCTVCRVDAEDVADMIAEIRALTPKPGLAFGSEPVHPVIPDVFVREGPDGDWQVELNSDTLPRLLVNSRYYAKVSGAKEKGAAEYLGHCLNCANWLVKSLDQRARTILKVAGELVRQQDAFLTHGIRHLRPLNLRAIADAIGMHESTVSRVTSNKYIATPRGTFEMKYFFTAALSASDGREAHSATAVRDRIREMIEKELPGNVLSDDHIVTLLTSDGVNIARRTVAKYREAMRIPSSVERKKFKLGEAVAAR